MLDIALPETVIIEGNGFLSGPRPELLVAEGDAVEVLQPLARHRRQGWQSLVSPVSGRISRIIPGPRRSIDRIEIAPSPSTKSVTPLDDLHTREGLVSAALWHLVRSRPFDVVASPNATPCAVLVTAFFSDPLGPNPVDVMNDHDRAAFEQGLKATASLASCGAVMIHCGPDPMAGADIPGLSLYRVRGNAERKLGVLVHRLGPASRERPVWYVDWQGVVDIGRRAQGKPGPIRRLHTLRRTDGALQVVSAVVGTSLVEFMSAAGVRDGHVIEGEPALLRDLRVTGWVGDRLSVLQSYPSPRPKRATGPVLPNRALEAALPQIPAPALLLKALAVGDDETAVRLGAFDLGPEDVALCSYLCVSGNDYAELLSQMIGRTSEEWSAS